MSLIFSMRSFLLKKKVEDKECEQEDKKMRDLKVSRTQETNAGIGLHLVI